MGEVKKVKKTKPSKRMDVCMSPTLRGLVNTAVELDIQQEDMVSFLKDKEQYILVYFK